jgi:hypothetical protein
LAKVEQEIPMTEDIVRCLEFLDRSNIVLITVKLNPLNVAAFALVEEVQSSLGLIEFLSFLFQRLCPIDVFPIEIQRRTG